MIGRSVSFRRLLVPREATATVKTRAETHRKIRDEVAWLPDLDFASTT